MSEIHNAIMNLRCKEPEEYQDAAVRMAYRVGHRDARHAAAELVATLEAERDALRKDAALYAGIVRIEYNDVYVAACRRQGVGPDSFDVYLEKCRAIDRAAIAAKESNRE